jgi:hypothetical protein
MGKKSGSGFGIRIREGQPRSFFLELRNPFFRLKILFYDADPRSWMEKFGFGILNGKMSDPG